LKYIKYLFLTYFLLSVVQLSLAQERSKFGVMVTNSVADYNKQVQVDPRKQLVDLEDFIPGIVLDIRYATANNFTKEVIYDQARAYARKPVAEALLEVQQELAKQGKGLKIYDAYRPYDATVRFYEVYKDTSYVASPYKGSRHNRGCAVDITLIDLATGAELKMPTEYDSFRREAWANSQVSDAEAFRNRELLKSTMHKHGFKVTASEWWHYDFIGWSKYELLNISFEALKE
jgi:D-alanyl-D-alanine dipeptidase